jgi:CMP/dCMP kinase
MTLRESKKGGCSLEPPRFFVIVPVMRQNYGFTIAIDGPAGSGKSTTARLCAERLGFHHLDTGAMYRAVTVKVLREETDLADTRALAGLLRNTRVGVTWDRRGMRVLLDGRDVSEEIRRPEVSGLVSEVSAIPAVRRKMVAEQRKVASGRTVVCEGRDIGSVVFPNADLKIYLECDASERARRRQIELAARGTRVSVRAVLSNLAKRDRIDSGRNASPLVRVPDALLVDTTMLAIEEQVAVVCDLARRRLLARR